MEFIRREPLAVFLFLAFLVAFTGAMVAINQRDAAIEYRAQFDGKSLVCRMEQH